MPQDGSGRMFVSPKAVHPRISENRLIKEGLSRRQKGRGFGRSPQDQLRVTIDGSPASASLIAGRGRSAQGLSVAKVFMRQPHAREP